MRQSGRTRVAVKAAREDTLRLEGSGPDVKGEFFRLLTLFSVVLGVVTLCALLVHTLFKGWPRLDMNLLTQMPSTLDPTTSGMLSAIVGTTYVMLGVLLTAVPIGVSAAVYLEEYADGSKWYNRLIELNIQNLAAVPSIVFGILGLAFIYRGPLSLGGVAFAGSLTLTMLVLPTVILASREALRAVPSSLRAASMGLGATQWDTIRRQVLPAAMPGILTGTILAMSRAIGETAPLLLVGATTFVQFNPDSPFSGAYTTLPVQIFNWALRPQDEFRVLAAAGTMVLIGLLLVMNSFAIWLRNRFSREY
ncbi:phosphate ABC transporter permease PstA [Nocardioides sp.]|uniref:phosphate ABC transporter permease PstA n=1 Tax=Nocardioides sp. TaxID=35761 RepID=UPI00273612E7|nr:phosphate ABC transporter permease PstA [Nocardioides sp.]MDP3893211.1 phosphate ABC transporter permease PstA [Nocardioides sp.]